MKDIVNDSSSKVKYIIIEGLRAEDLKLQKNLNQ